MDWSKLPIPGYVITAFAFFLIACAGIVIRWVMNKLSLLEELTVKKINKLDDLPDKEWYAKISKLEEDLPNKEWFKKREEVEEEILKKLPEPRRIAKHYALMHKANGFIQKHELKIEALEDQVRILNTKVFGA